MGLFPCMIQPYQPCGVHVHQENRPEVLLCNTGTLPTDLVQKSTPILVGFYGSTLFSSSNTSRKEHDYKKDGKSRFQRFSNHGLYYH